MRHARPAAMVLLATLVAAAAMAGGRSQSIRDAEGREVTLYENSHALLIGVSDYTGGWPDLDAIPRELDTVAAVLAEHGFTVERSMDPTGAELIQTLERFLDSHGYDEDNRLLVFYSGHGYTRAQGKKGYLVPADAPDPRVDERGFLRRAVSMSRILTLAREIEARHALFVFDSCFSGTIFKSKGLTDQPAHISARTAKPVRQFITAGSAGEEVPAFSAFTPYFVRALRGEGDVNRDGYVTGVELGSFLLDKVVGGETPQTPQFGKLRDPDLDEGDFVFRLPGGPPPPRRSAAAAPRPAETAPTAEFELEYWRSIRDSSDPADFEAYLRQYPDGRFEALARNRLAQLGSGAEERRGGESRPPAAAGRQPPPPAAAERGCRPRSAAGDSPRMRQLVELVTAARAEQRTEGEFVEECYGYLGNGEIERLRLWMEPGYRYTLYGGCGNEECGTWYTVLGPDELTLADSGAYTNDSFPVVPVAAGEHPVAIRTIGCELESCPYVFVAQRLSLAEIERRRAEWEASQPPVPAVTLLAAPTYRYDQPGAGGPGMTFSIPGTIVSAVGRSARLIAWFSLLDGRPVYNSAGHQVTALWDFQVATDPFYINAIALHVPYHGFNLPPTNYQTTYPLQVAIQLMIDGVVYATSPPTHFTVRW